MSGKSERTLNTLFGTPTATDTTQVSVSSAVASGLLQSGELYRLVATEDCYISFNKPAYGGVGGSVGDANVTSTTGMLLIGGVPEVFSTNDREHAVSVIQKSTSGTLFITRLKTRGY